MILAALYGPMLRWTFNGDAIYLAMCDTRDTLRAAGLPDEEVRSILDGAKALWGRMKNKSIDLDGFFPKLEENDRGTAGIRTPLAIRGERTASERE